MKKILIGGLVGGILLFAWQTISWTVANLHEKGQQYTTKQDSIMSYLNNSGLAEGSYMLPRANTLIKTSSNTKDKLSIKNITLLDLNISIFLNN